MSKISKESEDDSTKHEKASSRYAKLAEEYRQLGFSELAQKTEAAAFELGEIEGRIALTEKLLQESNERLSPVGLLRISLRNVGLMTGLIAISQLTIGIALSRAANFEIGVDALIISTGAFSVQPLAKGTHLIRHVWRRR